MKDSTQNPSELTLEQEFRLRLLAEEIESLDSQKMREYLLEAMQQLMLKDNWVKHALKECILKG